MCCNAVGQMSSSGASVWEVRNSKTMLMLQRQRAENESGLGDNARLQKVIKCRKADGAPAATRIPTPSLALLLDLTVGTPIARTNEDRQCMHVCI
jgi:hypothetical protein